ncbi:MAG TPA: hypothetical protein V6D19_06735 [Stenomitos sp.]
MIIILILTLSGITYWSLRLMQRAFEQREFSLMFAGTLVALAGGGIIAAYTLMEGCVGYLGHAPAAHLPASLTAAYAEEVWVPFTEASLGLDLEADVADNISPQLTQDSARL